MISELVGGGNASVMGYYEYYQFKRAVFECTSLTYDSDTGRVDYIEFTFTGTIE